MQKILVILAFALVALPAWAQTQQQHDWCTGAATDDQTIEGCTALIDSGQETTENMAFFYHNRAVAYNSKGLPDLAIADNSKAIALKPDYADAYNGRAWARHLKREDIQALPDIDKALALAPDTYYFETRAEIYEKLGQREKALADYRASLKLDPNHDSSKKGLIRLGVTP